MDHGSAPAESLFFGDCAQVAQATSEFKAGHGGELPYAECTDARDGAWEDSGCRSNAIK